MIASSDVYVGSKHGNVRFYDFTKLLMKMSGGILHRWTVICSRSFGAAYCFKIRVIIILRLPCRWMQ